MDAFTVLDAKAAPLMRQDVNTDIIIPIHRLRDVAQADLSDLVPHRVVAPLRFGGHRGP